MIKKTERILWFKEIHCHSVQKFKYIFGSLNLIGWKSNIGLFIIFRGDFGFSHTTVLEELLVL